MDYGGYGILDRNALTWNEGIASALIDNAPEGQAAVASETEPSETSETTVQTTETTSAETTQSQVETTVSQGVTPAESVAADDNNSPIINEQKVNFPLLLILGVVVVAAAYAGLFLLGRKNGRK